MTLARNPLESRLFYSMVERCNSEGEGNDEVTHRKVHINRKNGGEN